MAKETKTHVDSEAANSSDISDTADWFDRIKSLVDMGVEVRISASGHSMWPALLPGKDIVTLGPPGDLKKGEIVLASCSSPAITVLHRIREVTPDGAVLMGDFNLYQTEICHYESVAGKVIAIESGSRFSTLRQKISAIVQQLPASLRRLTIRLLNLFRS